MMTDKSLADEETRRVSLAIENVREDGARDIAMLESHLKNETDMIAELSEIISDLEKKEQDKTETMQDQIAKIKLQEKQIEMDKETILGLHTSVNEGHANVSALRLRLKDVMNENAKMTQDLADDDAAVVVLREKLENVCRVFTSLNIKHCVIITHSYPRSVKNVPTSYSNTPNTLEHRYDLSRTVPYWNSRKRRHDFVRYVVFDLEYLTRSYHTLILYNRTHTSLRYSRNSRRRSILNTSTVTNSQRQSCLPKRRRKEWVRWHRRKLRP